MVADDEVDTAFVSIVNLLNSLDAAVEHNHQSESVIGCIIDALI